MSSERLNEIFDDCLLRLNAGATVDQCLRDYPGEVDRLRPLLETVSLMRRALPPTQEVMTAQNRVRATMIAATQSVGVSPRRSVASRRWVGALASAAVLIFALMGVIGYAAEGAIPGDPLFPFKLLSESARLTVIHDPALASEFAQRRVNEVKTVLADGRQVNVSFAAHVGSISGARWDVGGIPVEVGPTTRITEPIQPGNEVIVEGFASAGVVNASEIEKLTPQKPSSTPIPSVTPAPSIGLTIIPQLAETPIPATATPDGSCTPTAPAGWISYTVRAGDSYSRLASVTSISMETLLSVNCLTASQMLNIGQTLFLPSVPPTLAPRATVAQSANTGGSNSVDAGGSSQGSGSGSVGGSDDHGGSSNSGSGNSGSGNSGSGGSDDNSGSGGSGNSGSGNSGSGGSDDGGSSNSGSGGSNDNSGHGSGSDDGGGHGGSNDDD